LGLRRFFLAWIRSVHLISLFFLTAFGGDKHLKFIQQ
jgi:hypothetical protein